MGLEQAPCMPRYFYDKHGFFYCLFDRKLKVQTSHGVEDIRRNKLNLKEVKELQPMVKIRNVFRKAFGLKRL